MLGQQKQQKQQQQQHHHENATCWLFCLTLNDFHFVSRNPEMFKDVNVLEFSMWELTINMILRPSDEREVIAKTSRFNIFFGWKSV